MTECSFQPSNAFTSLDRNLITNPALLLLEELTLEQCSVQSECRDISPAFNSTFTGFPPYFSASNTV